MGVAGKEVFEATLYACAMAAHRACLSQLRFAAPPNHPLIRHLLQYRSTHEMAISRNSGGMIAIVDLVETLESLIPEWEQQVRRQGARRVKGGVYADAGVGELPGAAASWRDRYQSWGGGE